ncbi:MAG: ABC-three component system middle component 6 [Bdellovibrionota bacterium]|nr:ABC-three component system middle component 6 [Bdellovibrionota bacterium]
MIFPTKRLSIDRSLIFVGAELLELLVKPKTVNQLWAKYRNKTSIKEGKKIITFEIFNLALDFLYVINVVDFKDGKVIKVSRD